MYILSIVASQPFRCDNSTFYLPAYSTELSLTTDPVSFTARQAVRVTVQRESGFSSHSAAANRRSMFLSPPCASLSVIVIARSFSSEWIVSLDIAHASEFLAWQKSDGELKMML